MRVITCYKLSPENQDMQVKQDRTISFERAEWAIGDFDLVAMEAGVRIAAQMGATHVGLSVGSSALSNKKERKNALSRGLDQLALVVDDALDGADTNLTAKVLCAAVQKLGDCGLVVCGEGSADYYYRQTGLQLGERLGWPVINGISQVTEVTDGAITAQRVTEDTVQTVVIPLPAVIMVTADYAPSKIPSMKDILAAGKKPVEELALSDLGEFAPVVDVVSLLAPASKERKGIILDGATDEAVDAFVSYLAKEGIV